MFFFFASSGGIIKYQHPVPSREELMSDLKLHNASNDSYWTMATELILWAIIAEVDLSQPASYLSYEDAVFLD